MQFEIQGVPITARVASMREVDWQRVQPNFFMVFPEGVLESAPQFYAIVARAESNQAAARLQRAVVERFPNVSVIDLSLILNTLNSILGKVSAAMRFVALFTIITGLAVLASAVLGSRAQRMRESILLANSGRAAASDPRRYCRGISVIRRYRRRRGRSARPRRDLGLEHLLFRHAGGDFISSGVGDSLRRDRGDGVGRRDRLLGHFSAARRSKRCARRRRGKARLAPH